MLIIVEVLYKPVTCMLVTLHTWHALIMRAAIKLLLPCCLRRVIMPAYGAAPYLPAIVLERPVYLREMSDGLYSPFTYLLYKVRLLPQLSQLVPACLRAPEQLCPSQYDAWLHCLTALNINLLIGYAATPTVFFPGADD